MAIRLRHMGVNFRLKLPESLPVLSEREVEIGQVLVNLVDNAANVMEEAGTVDPRVTIRARERRGTLIVEVEDNGPGFACDEVDHAFDDFSTGRDGGTGLELRICRRIVRDHGGSLTIANPRNPTVIQIRFGPEA